MIDRISLVDSTLHVHSSATSLKLTTSFLRGGISVDRSARTITFGQLSAVALPDGLTLSDGDSVRLQLVAADGTLRKQTREGVFKASSRNAEIIRVAGQSKTTRKFSAEDGWGVAVYKYRAYFTHPGVETDGGIPKWLQGSIERQHEFWNRLAWHCREARRKCSPVPTEEIQQFVASTVLPAIDALNDSLGRSKGKMKHPPKLKVAMPGLDAVWKFIGELRTRTEKAQPVPENLLEKAMEFAGQFKADYGPMNSFLADLDRLAETESEKLGLRRYEIRPLMTSFKSQLDRRRTTKAQWSDGWPNIKYPDSPKAGDWGLHFYFNKAGVLASGLDTEKGVPGLSWGPKLPVASTGSSSVGWRAKGRDLRAAEISVGSGNDEDWSFRFAVLQHRPLPAGSHIKEWKLIQSDGKLWLCLVVELKRPIPIDSPQAAGLDVGWRRTKDGVRFGVLYEPATKTFRELSVDLHRTPANHYDPDSFRIDLGPTRWEKRNISKLVPDWKPGDPIPGAFETRTSMQVRRSYLKDTAKIFVKRHLGESAPVWLDKAGSRGLVKLAEDFKDDAALVDYLTNWRRSDEQIGALAKAYSERFTKRIQYGQMQVAHDVCRHLVKTGIFRLVVETKFIAKTSQSQVSEDSEALKNSQKYRHLVAASRFISVLKHIAVKYGVLVEEQSGANTTRVCHSCGAENPSTEKETQVCEGCGRTIHQDQNAAMNLSDLGSENHQVVTTLVGSGA